ncbi:MAG: hypothetical protein QXL46_04060 [Nitrososphaerales archaeon]
MDVEETVYNFTWLQQLADEMAFKYTGGTLYEKIALEILKRLGFGNIRKGIKWDIEAEKDGKEYVIEVKGSGKGEDVVIRWHQLESLWDVHVMEGKVPLLMFVNSRGQWLIYEVLDGYLKLRD